MFKNVNRRSAYLMVASLLATVPLASCDNIGMSENDYSAQAMQKAKQNHQTVDAKPKNNKVSEDILLIKTENLINRVEAAKNSGLVVKAVRVEKGIPSVQIAGLVPIVVEFKMNGLPVQSIVYTNEDGTAYITGLVYRYDTSVYGDAFFKKSLTDSKLAAEMNKEQAKLTHDDYAPKATKQAERVAEAALDKHGALLQAEASMGVESLQGGKNDADKITKPEQLKIVKEKRKALNPTEKTFDFLGKKITANDLWADILDKQTLYIEEGNKDAPLFYIIHDPWCPVCHNFFKESRELVRDGKVRIRWVTVFGLGPHGGFAGRSSFDAGYRILAAKDPVKAFVEYESKNILPDVSNVPMNQELLKKMKFNIDVTHFVLNGTQLTPSVIWRGKSGLLGLKAGLSAKGMGEIAASGKMSSN